MEKLAEYAWTVISAIFWFFLSRLTSKIDDLEKGRASSDELNEVRKNLNDEIVSARQGLRELDRRVDDIDHATQLRLVPREEYKADISALHNRCNILSDTKEDKIKTIRVSGNDQKKGK